jgi:polysaccharide pyruvyl transferase WcaK-like protein
MAAEDPPRAACAQRAPQLKESTAVDRAPLVCLLIPISSATEQMPLRRPPMAWLRNRARRGLDRLAWRVGRDVAFHYSTYEDRAQSNVGDIAIRLASVQLLRAALGKVEIREISWAGPRPDAEWINANASLFIIGGGGYLQIDDQGHLPPRVARDVDLIERLRCPVVSFAPGVNRLLRDGRDREEPLNDMARAVAARLLARLDLSSSRDPEGVALLESVVPGRTELLADPALFLDPAGPPEVARTRGRLTVGLNVAFHGPASSRHLNARLRLVGAAARAFARRHPCEFRYFVHSDAERAIPALLNDLGVPVSVVQGRADDLLRWYAGLDLHLCQMLHSAILATDAGVPTVNLGYDRKNLAFFRMMELPEQFLPAEGTCLDELVSALDRTLADGYAQHAHIAARKAVLKARMANYLDRVAELVLPSSTRAASSGLPASAAASRSSD